MTEIIDLTSSPHPEIIEISSDQGNTGHIPTSQGNRKRKRRKGKTPNDLVNGGVDSSAQSSKAHSPEAKNEHDEPNESVPHTMPPTDEPGLFVFDSAAVPIILEGGSLSPEPANSNQSGDDGDKLLLPSHVAVLRDNGPILAVDVIQPPSKLDSDDEEYIEYLDYEDRKAPGLVRYFEVEEEAGQSKSSIFKCKKCGAEGDHKTYNCPIQICLTCGARDEHSTRSCPISKTCYTCGMKGHINKTCPNRYSAHVASSGFHGDCDRCGSSGHQTNECPTLWRIYQYVNDEERVVIMQSREERKQLAIGEGGEGYIGEAVWCYNCANTGHLGDDCDEFPHPANFPTECSAFSLHNVASGPFYDPASEPVSARRGSRERKGEADRPHFPDYWNTDVPVDVGKRGKNKDKERLEKKFREQEDEGEDWFNDTRNTRRRGMDRQMRPSGPRGKTLKFGPLRDGGHRHTSPPPTLSTSGNGPSLLARLSDSHGRKNRRRNDHGYDQHEPSHRYDGSFHIRGAATDPRNEDGTYANSRRTHSERGQDRRDRDKPGHGGSRRGHGPRYKGGYDR